MDEESAKPPLTLDPAMVAALCSKFRIDAAALQKALAAAQEVPPALLPHVTGDTHLYEYFTWNDRELLIELWSLAAAQRALTP